MEVPFHSTPITITNSKWMICDRARECLLTKFNKATRGLSAECRKGFKATKWSPGTIGDKPRNFELGQVKKATLHLAPLLHHSTPTLSPNRFNMLQPLNSVGIQWHHDMTKSS
ncbi:hypothetical protein TNCV_2577251 [Trichonephila clavipes]|nr:hypothetical protein TNCV_2577251 [Trichonephila clavipes]